MDISWKQQFLEQLEAAGDKLVLVDFWADRCGPCKMLKPELERLAEKHESKIVLLKVNVDDSNNSELSMEFGVRSIPQVTFFLHKDKKDQFIWALPPAKIEELILSNIWE